jgi:hypothetical protein
MRTVNAQADEGFLGKPLVAVGSTVRPGGLLAFLVENEEDLDAVNAADQDEFRDCEDFLWEGYLK